MPNLPIFPISATVAYMSTPQVSIDADDLNEEIGRRVHQLMWDRKVTQTEFGRVIGMDQSSVAKRLRGKLGWSAAQLKITAAVLNSTVAYLMGETEDPYRPTDGPAGASNFTV